MSRGDAVVLLELGDDRGQQVHGVASPLFSARLRVYLLLPPRFPWRIRTTGAFQEEILRGDGPFQCGACRNADAYVTKLNPFAASGPDSLVYSTYLGSVESTFACSSASEWGTHIGLDASGNAIVAGEGATTLSAFPLVNPSPCAGTCYTFLAKLDAAGRAFLLDRPGGSRVFKASTLGSTIYTHSGPHRDVERRRNGSERRRGCLRRQGQR